MQLTGNTVLITGGTSGIGMALAIRLLQLGNTVAVCGRDEKKLAALQAAHPQLHARVCDVGKEVDRIDLWNWATTTFPNLNVLLNNAGIQRRVNLKAPEPWSDTDQEIAINLGGPVHLSMLAVPHLLQQDRAFLINVSSGLAFVPLTRSPVYSATKAAIHSFTLSLRHQLAGTNVDVIEIIPPAVRTNLGGSHDFGEPLDEFTTAVLEQLQAGREEVTYTFSARSSQASRAELDQILKTLNA